MGVGAGHSPEGLVPVAAMCPISFGLVCVHVPPQCRHLLDWNAKGSLGKGEKFKIPKSWRFGEIMSSSLPDFCSMIISVNEQSVAKRSCGYKEAKPRTTCQIQRHVLERQGLTLQPL